MPKIDNPIKSLREIAELKAVNLYNEKEFLLFKYNERNILYCDGIKTWEDNNDLFKEAYNFNGKYILSRCEFCNKNKNFHNTMLECYRDLKHTADNLKIATKGKINLYITGSLKHTGLKLLFELLHKKQKIDLMALQFVKHIREYQWLNACNTGALIYSEDNFKGEIEAYDINSYYPSIMKSEIDFPIAEGSFVKLDYISETPLFGIYKAKILSKVNPYLFRINSNNFYTHIDLKRAKELNYEIELVQDGHENFLRYTNKERKKAKSLFGDYMDYLYDIRMKYKSKDNVIETYLKLLISSLWGQLSETKTFRVIEDEDGNFIKYEEREGDTHIKSTRLNNGGFEHEFFNINDPFKTRFARIKLFLLAQGRYKMSSLIEDNIANVVQVQTDGFLVKPSQKHYELGPEIGKLKLEYKGQAKINNVNNIEIVCSCGQWHKKSAIKEHLISDIHKATIIANNKI